MVKERLANKATECKRATIKKSDFFFKKKRKKKEVEGVAFFLFFVTDERLLSVEKTKSCTT